MLAGMLGTTVNCYKFNNSTTKLPFAENNENEVEKISYLSGGTYADNLRE